MGEFIDKLIDLDRGSTLGWPMMVGILIIYPIMEVLGDNWVLGLIFFCQVIVLVFTGIFYLKPLTDYNLKKSKVKFVLSQLGFFSLLVPGSGQIGLGLKSRGLLILAIGIVVEFILFFYRGIFIVIPGIIFLLWNVYDTESKAKKLR